jgi:hypothetical protein
VNEARAQRFDLRTLGAFGIENLAEATQLRRMAEWVSSIMA